MPKTFCVVGHDARQQAAARVLRRAGYGVTAADNAAAADYILLPMSQGRVSDEVARALQGAGQGTLILAGRPGMPVRMAAREAGLPLIDYFLRPELECLNAVPTAEGCLELLLRLRERTIWESGFLVLGYAASGAPWHGGWCCWVGASPWPPAAPSSAPMPAVPGAAPRP